MLFHPSICSNNSKDSNEVSILIQPIYNRKRLRKRGRKHNKREIDFKTVLYAIFEKYQIIDHIATSEIDPYWSYLYKLYEKTIYIKKYIINSIIYDDKIYFWDCNELFDILKNLLIIEDKLFNYLCGYFELLVRLTLKKRFWGWKFYFDDKFYPDFYELLIFLLKSLSFDPDKAKPSVYFVNSCWFRGIQITKEIMNSLQTEQYFYFDSRGRMVFNNDDSSIKFSNEVSFEDESFIGDVDLLIELENYFKSDTSKYYGAFKEEQEIIDNEKNKKISKSELNDVVDEEKDIEQTIHVSENNQDDIFTCESLDEIMESNERKMVFSSIIDKIIKYFNFSNIDDIYNNISLIRSKISDIEFTDKEIEYLKDFIKT